MSHKIMLTYFLTALYLVSCSHSSSNYSVSPQPDITQSQIRLSATVEVSYTQTAVVLPSTTPTTSATIDLTKSIPIVLTDATIPTTPSNFRLHPDARLEINCLEIASDLPKHNKLAGMFVFSPTFEDQFQEEKPDAYLNLLKPKKKYPLDPENTAGGVELLQYLLPQYWMLKRNGLSVVATTCSD